MIKYPSIEQFRNVIRQVRERHDFQGKTENGEPIFQHLTPYPTIKFKGTTKLHGCLDENTLITLANGDSIPIREITIGTWVLSKNIETGEVVSNKVINIWNSNSDKEWVELIFEKSKKLICTTDHLIWTTNRGYVAASCLESTDDIEVLVP